MLYKRLKQFAKKNAWKINKNFAYGEIDGYLFTIADIQGFKVFLTPLLGIKEEQKDVIIDFLNKNKENLNLFQVLFDKDVLIVKFREIFRNTKIETMEGYLSSITQFLKQNGIACNKVCGICNKEGAEQKAYIDFVYVYVHNQCLDEATHEIESAAMQIDCEDKNYLLGFIGALIGGIISSIPWIVLQLHFDTVAAVLAYLIVIGAFKSYTLFKGKVGKLTKWIIAFVAIVSVISTQFALIGIVFLKNGIPISIGNFQRIFEIKEISLEFHRALKLGLFMAFLGIIPFFIELKGNAKEFFPKIQRDR